MSLPKTRGGQGSPHSYVPNPICQSSLAETPPSKLPLNPRAPSTHWPPPPLPVWKLRKTPNFIQVQSDSLGRDTGQVLTSISLGIQRIKSTARRTAQRAPVPFQSRRPRSSERRKRSNFSLGFRGLTCASLVLCWLGSDSCLRGEEVTAHPPRWGEPTWRRSRWTSASPVCLKDRES